MTLISDGGNARIRIRIKQDDGSNKAAVVTLVGPGAFLLPVNSTDMMSYNQPGKVLGPGPNVTLCHPAGMAMMNDGTGETLSSYAW